MKSAILTPPSFLGNMCFLEVSREIFNMAANAVAVLVNNLANSNDKLESLEELKILLSSIAPQELRNVVPNISMLPVFECLNSEEKYVFAQSVCVRVFFSTFGFTFVRVFRRLLQIN
jgi:hypothetical protein